MHLRATRRVRGTAFLEEPISHDGEGNEVTLMDFTLFRAGATLTLPHPPRLGAADLAKCSVAGAQGRQP